METSRHGNTILMDRPTDGMDTFLSWKTILLNCECHTFDDVITQVMKATRCSYEKAKNHAIEAHTKGSTVVYGGCKERCEAVAECLESIGLRTLVDQ